MIIYKDIITGDKMFSDNYPMKLINDVVYEVQGKWISRDPDTIALANADLLTEGVEEDYKDLTELGIDIVMNFRLRECFRFHNKESFILYLKKYMQNVIEKLQDSAPDQVEIFKTNMNHTMLKYTLGHFEELEFYTGVSMDDNGMVAVCDYQVIDDELVPFLKFFKHGLLEEKV